MRAFIVGDYLRLSGEASEILKRSGFDCRATDRVSLGYAAEFLAHARRDVIVLFMSPRLDEASRVLRELRSLAAAPILAIGPVNDPKFILRVLREGATEYLDENDLETDLEQSLVRLKTKNSPEVRRGKVIGVLSASGGTGVSSVVVNLATVLAKQHKRSAVFDLRLASGDQSLLLDVKPSHTLAELCGQLDRLDPNMFKQCLLKHESGVHLLAAPAAIEMISQVTSQGVRQILPLARTLFPFVVVDLDRTFATEQLAAIVSADLLVLVMKLDLLSLSNTNRLLDYLDELGVPQDRVRIVINRHKQARELPVSRASSALKQDIFHCLPDDVAQMNQATNSGVPVVLQQPRAKISRSLKELAKKLEEVCKVITTTATTDPRQGTVGGQGRQTRAAINNRGDFLARQNHDGRYTRL